MVDNDAMDKTREQEEAEELAALWAGGQHSNFVPGRYVVASARAIKAHRAWVARGCPIKSTVKTPWTNYGECSGGPSTIDIDGVGSWGKHVRQYEDRDDDRQ